MSLKRPFVLVLAILFTCGSLLLAPGAASGDAKSELAKVVKQGKALWSKQWKKGAKTCATCHTKGANKLTAKRFNTWPKYGKLLKKVSTGQEKIAQMIKKHGGGELALGSAELTALEAYIKTR